jgi:PPOX class probable F420-dependent enzyme
MILADTAVQRFLSTKDVVVLATIGADGAPLLTPMWFLHDASTLTMVSIDDMQKIRNLRRDPRVFVVAESGTRDDVRGVSIRGRAEFLGESPERRALADRWLTKYDPHAERLWKGRTMPPNRVMFRISPEHVHAWSLV